MPAARRASPGPRPDGAGRSTDRRSSPDRASRGQHVRTAAASRRDAGGPPVPQRPRPHRTRPAGPEPRPPSDAGAPPYPDGPPRPRGPARRSSAPTARRMVRRPTRPRRATFRAPRDPGRARLRARTVAAPRRRSSRRRTCSGPRRGARRRPPTGRGGLRGRAGPPVGCSSCRNDAAPSRQLVLHATRLRIPIVEVEGGSLTALAGFDGHQGVALVVEPRRFADARRHPRPGRRARRAAVRPRPRFARGSRRTSGRCCAAPRPPGVHGVVFPTRRQAPLTPAAVKASAGAIEHLLLCPGRRPAPARWPTSTRRGAPHRRRRGGRAADRPPDRPARTAGDRHRQRGPGPGPGRPHALRPVHADPDARRDRLAQRRRRRLDPAVRGGRPARPGRPPLSAERHRRGSRRTSPHPSHRVRPTASSERRRRRRPKAARTESDPDAPATRTSLPRRPEPSTRPAAAGAEPPEAEETPRTAATLDPSDRRGPIIPRRRWGHLRYGPARRADVAQLVEQRFCKPQVPGSSPVVGSMRT